MAAEALAPFTPEQRRQLFRFCLYGFLKNQQFYAPFFMLALLDKGLSFTSYGTLMAFSLVCVNLMEIPTGAVADVWGRRRVMITSFASYIGSFVALAFFSSYWALFPAMMLYAAGEAFREGTHKAMIFDWLTRLGRAGEKTRIYGMTRFWSKLGSALGVVLAAAIVLHTRDYRWVFVLSALPFALNIVNFLFYPKWLDGEPGAERSVTEVFRTLWAGLRLAFTKRQLRGLIVESMCFEGVYEAAKDYLQPLVQAVAVVAMADYLRDVDGRSRTAILMAAVGVPMAVLSSLASRHSHRAANTCGGDDRLAAVLWVSALALYLLTGAALFLGWGAAAIGGFVAATLVQNVWRPTLVSRYYCHAETGSAATTLSVESQAKSLAAVAIYPLLGLAVDHLAGKSGTVAAKAAPIEALWPVAAAGALFCAVGLVINLRMHWRHWQSQGQPAGPG